MWQWHIEYDMFFVFVMAKFDVLSKQVTQEHMIVMYNLFQQRA